MDLATLRQPLLLFDGVCNLCNGAVNFVIDHDRDGRVAFAPLQSPLGAQVAAAAGVAPGAMSTMILVDGGEAHVRSDAALRLARYLGFPWSLLRALRLVPRPLRDAAYGIVARHRYRWFGRSDTCRVPTPEIRARFVDGAAAI